MKPIKAKLDGYNSLPPVSKQNKPLTMLNGFCGCLQNKMLFSNILLSGNTQRF